MGPIMYLTFLAGAAGLLWLNLRPAGDEVRRSRRLLLVWLAALALHFTYAQGGWFYRYEAYLCATGIAVCAAALAAARGCDTLWRRHAPPGAWLPALLLAGVVLWPLAQRGLQGVAEIPTATRNIGEQQIRMGEFLRAYAPPGTAVAVNDLGAVSFLADVRCLDLAGLATPEIAAARRRGDFDGDLVARLAAEQDVRWAVLYADLLAEAIPAGWTPVARWTIDDLLVCAGATVTWFACRPDEESPLRSALHAFAAELPPGVTVEELP
jgi:hypothetical protein